MSVDAGPLTWSTVATTGQVDPVSAGLIVVLAGAYAWCYRRYRKPADSEQPVGAAAAWCFAAGVVLWILATLSAIGAYAYLLFWMRALQVLLLIFVVPFLLALGKPVTVLRNGLGAGGRDRIDWVLAAPFTRVCFHPLTTSLALLGTPWLLYLTPWYTACLRNDWIGAPTRILLVVVGFGYFYARLQADPVPHRYSQLISLLISVAETLGDGLLGLVLWQGPLIASAYYAGLHRDWGPEPRLDQTIGAGVLWILGDVVGVPFVVLLMRSLSRDEKRHATQVDDELDRAEAAEPEGASRSSLWWENDPELRERFRRR